MEDFYSSRILLGAFYFYQGPFLGRYLYFYSSMAFGFFFHHLLLLCVCTLTHVCVKDCVSAIEYRYTSTSINRHERTQISANIFFLFYIHELAVGPRWIETKCVRPTSDGTRPSPHRCDITLERNRSLVQAQVNLNKALHTSVWCNIDEDLVESHQMFDYLV